MGGGSKGRRPIVRIARGEFSNHFQVARAWLSAASALVVLDKTKAIDFIDQAIGELQQLKVNLKRS
jgi:hypothetical protein